MIVKNTARGLAGAVAVALASAGPAQTQVQTPATTESVEVRIRTDIEQPLLPLTGKVQAYTLKSPDQMLPGQLADSFPGDLVLENDLVRAVVAHPEKGDKTPAGGGNLTDLVSQKNPIDYINYMQTVGDLDSTQSQVRYEAAEAPEVIDGTTASVTVTGSFTTDRAGTPPVPVEVTTRFLLPANSNRLQVTSTFTNSTSAPANIAPGDVVDWGLAHAFIPGHGMIGDLVERPVPYVIATADDFSAGYVTSGTQPLVGAHTPRHTIAQAIPVPKKVSATQTMLGENAGAAGEKLGQPAPQSAPVVSPPPARQTPVMLPPPGTETPYAPAGPETLYAPTGAETRYAPSDATQSPRPVPGGDGERFPSEETTAPQSSSPASSGTTESTAQNGEGGRITLAPGESFTWTRYLIVSDNSFARITRAAYEEKGVTTATVAGAVLESESSRPLEGAEVLVSGGPDWDRRSAPPAFTRTVSRSDGSYVVNLPPGHYLLTPTKNGRVSVTPPSTIEVTTGSQPQIVPLLLSKESLLRVTVTEADAPTSVPIPAKITFIPKPGTMPLNFGTGPGISKGVRNVFYMPFGAAIIPVTPGRYQVVVSRGIEYDIVRGDLTVVPGSDQRVDFVLPHSLKGQLEGMISADVGVMTTASAVSNASPADRVVQAVAEGVQVLVTGDYGVATDLEPVVEQLGLGNLLKTFPGMRLLLRTEEMTANLLAYPLSQEKATAVRNFVQKNPGLPPDVVLADLRREFPGIIFQIDTPLDPQQGYLTSFPFDAAKKEFTDDVMPPPDFDAIQLIEGKKWRMWNAVFPQFYDLLLARTRQSGARPLSGIGSSGSRLTFGEEVGYPRMYLYTRNSTPRSFRAEDLVRSVRGQHYVVTNGPVMTVTLLNPKTGEFDVKPGDVVDYSSTTTLVAKMNVVAAPWVPFSSFELSFNGATVDQTEVMPTRKVLRYPVQANPDTALRRRIISNDVVVDAFSVTSRRSLAPVVPAAPIDFGGEVFPFAWVGPIYVDQDGDGRVIAPEKASAGAPAAQQTP